ncbi:hypothetical protein DHX103_14310 [Planococcus sp. X10-3]|uniref:hypothetical protein n=1 Tax=Planococcus sp. X10-3 TaxID=3061240 RepID=UPI003BAF232E
MNITVTVEAPELVGALNNLASAFGNNPLAGVTQSDIVKPLETKEEKPKAKKEENAKQVGPEKEPEATPEKEPVKEEPVKEEPKEEKNTSGITLEVLTSNTRAFVQGNPANRKKLKGFLEEKGVPKVSELDPADYQAAIHFMDSNA